MPETDIKRLLQQKAKEAGWGVSEKPAKVKIAPGPAPRESAPKPTPKEYKVCALCANPLPRFNRGCRQIKTEKGGWVCPNRACLNAALNNGFFGEVMREADAFARIKDPEALTLSMRYPWDLPIPREDIETAERILRDGRAKLHKREPGQWIVRLLSERRVDGTRAVLGSVVGNDTGPVLLQIRSLRSKILWERYVSSDPYFRSENEIMRNLLDAWHILLCVAKGDV